MKHIVLFALVAILGLAACSTSKKDLPSFKLTLSVTNFDGKQVKVQKRVGDVWEVIDSVKVEASVAHLKGTIETPEMLFVAFEDLRGNVPFFAEASEITIKADPQNLRQAEINGSLTHERYQAFTDKFEEFDEVLYQHYQAYKSAEEAANEEGLKAAEAAYEQAEKDKKQFLVDYVRTNNKDVVSHYILYRNTYQFELDELEGMVVTFDETVKSSYLTDLFDRVMVLKSVAIGMPYKDFKQAAPNDSLIKLSDKVGAKVLLVDFWASWCQPCRAENPNIVAIYKDFKGKGFDIFGVSFDTDKEKWMQAITDDNLTWTHVSDLKGWGNEAGKKYGVQSIPHSVLLDANGNIIAKNLRGEDLRNKIAELLK
ncbi:MAG: alkyl hydroperoxide reductase [Bacteroidetes bacterium]|nr:MAG: alkyl hydroperoxide reductase [Bacteroidota bacterium]